MTIKRKGEKQEIRPDEQAMKVLLDIMSDPTQPTSVRVEIALRLARVH